MGCYWDDFIAEYLEHLHKHNLVVILEAFFCYCNHNIERADDMMIKFD